MEFKRLSDVEVVAEPTESANVLIEENGVIKKAPKTAVGGGAEWDAVIDVVEDWMILSNYTFTSGTYSDLRNKVLAGEKPNVLIRRAYYYGSQWHCILTPISFEASEDDGSIFWIVVTAHGNENFWLGINPDGTLTD